MKIRKINIALFALIMLVFANAFAGHKAAEALMNRVIPDHAEKFVTEVIATDDGKDVFEIESRDGKIVLRGNNGVSISSALYWGSRVLGFAFIGLCSRSGTLFS